MISEYDPALAVIDHEWLNRLGTAFAIAWYEDSCHRILARVSAVEAAGKAVEAILEESGKDEDGELGLAVEVAFGLSRDRHLAKFKAEENRLAAIRMAEWVDADITVTQESLLAHGITRSLETREEFENKWQKSEAGY